MEAGSTASHHSPGPPQVTCQGAAADEESQESMTLQNALPPLPGTQSHSPEDGLSSPTDLDLGVQLLSRPQSVDIDPGESFSWGKPLKIVPGKFGRPAPATSTVDAGQENVRTTSPFVISDTGSKTPDVAASGPVHSTPMVSRKLGPGPSRLGIEEPSQAVFPSIEGSLSSGEGDQHAAKVSESLPQAQSFARRPPFEDYQPQYQHPHGRNQATDGKPLPRRLSTIPEVLNKVETQHRDNSQAEGRVPHQRKPFGEQGRSQHSDDQSAQGDQPTNTVQTNVPRHRISLPNDTSISPAHIPQQLLQDKSQHREPREKSAQKSTLRSSPSLKLNRPMRDVRRVTNTITPTHCPSSRSSWHGSNISKRRSRPPLSVSGKARASHRHDSRHHDETPSIRRRYQQSGATYRSPSLGDGHRPCKSPDVDVVTGNLAGALNAYIGSMTTVWKRKDQDISCLEHNLRKKDEKLSNIQKESEGKAGRIQELENDRLHLQEELNSMNQQLENRSTKVSELQKKCRTYKEHLNAAIAEQQDLYKAAKSKCETAIKQMREEEQKRLVLDEQQRKDLQATSERLTQLVKSKIAEYSFKEREFHNKLESMDQRLQERDADVERERVTIRSLLEQNATVESVKGAVEAFEGQIEQISAKLGEIASGQVKRDGAAADETRIKLDQIAEHLSALDKKVQPQESIIKKIQEANMHTFSTILNPVIKSQTEFQTNLQKLSDAVENYMEDFWMKLEDREDVLTELLDQTQADNAQLQADVQLREEECSSILNRLKEAESAIRQREKTMNDLKNEIAQLERAQANDMEQAARADSLQQNCEKLKVEIAAKTAAARDLEIRLQQSREACSNERAQHKSHTQELQDLMKQRDETHRVAQQAAVEVARQEITRDMSIAKENMGTLLKQAEAERNTLKDELNLAKQQVAVVEETKRRAETTVEELRSELQTARAQTNKLGEERNEKDKEIRKTIEHSSKQVENLEAKVAHKEREITELSEDAQTYGKQVRKALDSLREWATGHLGVKGFISELRKAQKGNFESVNPKLKPFLEIDVLHQAIFQYCQVQGNSTSKRGQNAAEEPTTDARDAWTELPPSGPQELLPTNDLATRVLDEIGRRVTIKSPNQSAPSPIPPSVSEEQEHRRSANPPKSIMKASSQSTPTEDGDLVDSTRAAAKPANLPSRGFFGRRTYKAFALAKTAQEDRERQERDVKDTGAFTRSEFTRAPYNRPVSGTNPRVESDLAGDGAHVGRHPRKRKQADDQELEPSKPSGLATTKELARPLTKYLSPPEHQVSKGDDSRGPPSAPRKKARKDSNSLKKMVHPVRSSYFNQNDTTAERKAPRKGSDSHGAKKIHSGGLKASTPRASSNSQDSSQRSQSIDYPRRHSWRQNEDSKESITYSQAVRSEPSQASYVPNRCTMN